MRFLADMGVSQRIVEWLRFEGHDAVHLRDEQLHRLPNGAIFEKAEAEQRIILIFDLYFGEEETRHRIRRYHGSRDILKQLKPGAWDME